MGECASLSFTFLCFILTHISKSSHAHDYEAGKLKAHGSDGKRILNALQEAGLEEYVEEDDDDDDDDDE